MNITQMHFRFLFEFSCVSVRLTLHLAFDRVEFVDIEECIYCGWMGRPSVVRRHVRTRLEVIYNWNMIYKLKSLWWKVVIFILLPRSVASVQRLGVWVWLWWCEDRVLSIEDTRNCSSKCPDFDYMKVSMCACVLYMTRYDLQYHNVLFITDCAFNGIFAEAG